MMAEQPQPQDQGSRAGDNEYAQMGAQERLAQYMDAHTKATEEARRVVKEAVEGLKERGDEVVVFDGEVGDHMQLTAFSAVVSEAGAHLTRGLEVQRQEYVDDAGTTRTRVTIRKFM